MTTPSLRHPSTPPISRSETLGSTTSSPSPTKARPGCACSSPRASPICPCGSTLAETALIRGYFDGPLPNVSTAGGEVAIRYPRFGIADWLGGMLWGEGMGASLVLHPGVAWELIFHGGASQVDIDLRQGRVTGLEISGGASQVHLALPAPDAVVPLPRVRGGASNEQKRPSAARRTSRSASASAAASRTWSSTAGTSGALRRPDLARLRRLGRGDRAV